MLKLCLVICLQIFWNCYILVRIPEIFLSPVISFTPIFTQLTSSGRGRRWFLTKALSFEESDQRIGKRLVAGKRTTAQLCLPRTDILFSLFWPCDETEKASSLICGLLVFVLYYRVTINSYDFTHFLSPLLCNERHHYSLQMQWEDPAYRNVGYCKKPQKTE